jgi:hypothetical protein
LFQKGIAATIIDVSQEKKWVLSLSSANKDSIWLLINDGGLIAVKITELNKSNDKIATIIRLLYGILI